MKLIPFIFAVLLAACSAPDVAKPSASARNYSADERDIRMAICVDRIRHEESEIWFVDESAEFIEELKKVSAISSIRPGHVSGYNKLMMRPVDRESGETGYNFAISDVKIEGDTAKASVSWYASPMGGEWSTVILKKQSGRWIVIEWKPVAAA